MRIRRTPLALILLTYLATAAACGSDDTVEPSSETQSYLDQIDGYDSWRALVDDGPMQSGSHGGYVVTYANGDADGAIDSGDFPFPEGSLIVKEVYDEVDAESPSALDIMAKTSDDEGDWYWIGATGDGQRLRTHESSPIEGDVAMCAGCHGGTDTDFVFLDEYGL